MPRKETDNPTPEQIRTACRRIQSSWTTREELRRRLSAPPRTSLTGALNEYHGWMPPLISMGDMAGIELD
ncbi:MAG: hypothetical protein GY888_33070 [Planctomycetaceae bacterium]|nr:hypothetical protein [Planctomycetaceae bacterium]MEC9002397.1 hypothetical protein [Planctomycetota bacterium]